MQRMQTALLQLPTPSFYDVLTPLLHMREMGVSHSPVVLDRGITAATAMGRMGKEKMEDHVALGEQREEQQHDHGGAGDP